MKKKLTVMATMAFAVMLISAGTFALFTSHAFNDGNEFASGTVNVDITKPPDGDPVFNPKNIAPGDKGTYMIHVTNTGSLDAWIKLGDVVTEGDLFAGDHPIKFKYNSEAHKILASGTTSITVGWELPLAAGDEYQGKEGKATFKVQAVQHKNNEDPNNIKW